MRPSVPKVAAGALAVAGLILTNATPARALDAQWVHGLGWSHYLIPGPPPGPSLGLCFVSTRLEKQPPGDTALIYLNSVGNYPETCVSGWATVVTLDGANRVVTQWPTQATPVTDIGFTTHAALSTGPTGQRILGANFSAVNRWGFAPVWSVTVF